MSTVFSKHSYSIIDRMALVGKVKCAGLTSDKAADEIFNTALTSTNRSKKREIKFLISTGTSP